jgi:DnaJ-domain-containing protein 1
LEGQFDRPNLALFLNDFVNTKLNLEWLKNYFSKLMEVPPKWTKTADKMNPIFTFGPVAKLTTLAAELENAPNLVELAAKYRDREQEFLSAMLLLILHQMVYFPIKAKTLDVDIQMSRLRAMQMEIMHKDDFEVLAVPRKAKGNDIKKAYYELSKTYHPDRLPQGTDKTLTELTKAVFSRITAAYNRLSDDEKRTVYLKELEVGQAEKILAAENVVEEAKGLLKSGNAQKALERFRHAASLRPPSSELQLHIIWAELATAGPHNAKSNEIVAKAEMDYSRIPPEDRHNPLFYFVKGLLFKHKGDFVMAMDSIAHAVSVKPEFIEAKRELNLLQISQKKNSQNINILKADLKDVVGMLFKRK